MLFCSRIKTKSALIIMVTRNRWSLISSVTLYTVNSLMFKGINVCALQKNPCLRGLIFAVSSDHVNYLGP